MKTLELKTVPLADLEKAGYLCAWAGCSASFFGPMPKGWRNMLVYWQAEPNVESTIADICFSGHCDRDATLCPEHAAELESSLKPLSRLAAMPAEGEA